jgi:hypothetical protein
VVSLDQASYQFWRRFNGGVTLGFQYSKGNNTTQYNLASDLAYTESRFAVRLHYNSSFSSSTNTDAAIRNQADLSGYRLLKGQERYFYQAGINYLQSTVQGIEQQYGVAGGLGMYLRNTNRVKWTAQGGPAWQWTNYAPIEGAPNRQNIAGLLFGTRWESFRFKKTRLTANAYAIPALNEVGRVFTRANATYYLKFFGRLEWELSAYGSWDNRPPAHLQGSDYGSSVGFSYNFGNH